MQTLARFANIDNSYRCMDEWGLLGAIVTRAVVLSAEIMLPGLQVRKALEEGITRARLQRLTDKGLTSIRAARTVSPPV
jgi:hypothetical protein